MKLSKQLLTKSFVFILILVTSCTKTKFVHFYGYVKYECNHEPCKNKEFTISRYYDTGSNQAKSIASGVTDNNGNYSLTAEVEQTGSFMYYQMHIYGERDTSPFIQIGGGESHDNSGNVKIDGTALTYYIYSFHIKNSNPFNSNDVFKFIQSPGNNLVYYFSSNNFYGSTVDTTFFYFSENSPLYYNYSYTKNGLTTITQGDSTTPVACFDTSFVNILY